MTDAAAPLTPSDPAHKAPVAIDPADHIAVAKARASLLSRQVKILNELTLLADQSGLVSVPQTHLADATRLSLRTVRLACRELSDLGWIVRTPQSAGVKGRTPDRYRLNPAPMPKSQ